MKRGARAALALAVMVGVLGPGGTAAASTSEAVADTGGMTLDLELFGVPVNIAVTVDSIGHIAEVAVSDTAFEETHSGDHKVRFTNEADGTRIEVKAKGEKLKAEVKAGGVDGIVGNHSWSGDLFALGTATTVTFTVVRNTAGHPELTSVAVDASTVPGGVTYSVEGPQNSLDEDEAESQAKIRFMWNGFTMTLKIEAELHLDGEDGDHP
ncbi:MAG: hypothetical protein ACE5E8_07575, partial [Acidimicrobiia bacterium]